MLRFVLILSLSVISSCAIALETESPANVTVPKIESGTVCRDANGFITGALTSSQSETQMTYPGLSEHKEESTKTKVNYRKISEPTTPQSVVINGSSIVSADPYRPGTSIITSDPYGSGTVGITDNIKTRRDAWGQPIGTSATVGNHTIFRDQSGRTTGSATTEAGRTTYRDSSGRITGTSSVYGSRTVFRDASGRTTRTSVK